MNNPKQSEELQGTAPLNPDAAGQRGERDLPLHRLSIRTRLTVCFAFIILAMLVGNAFLLWQFQMAREQAALLSGVDRELIAVLQEHTNFMSFYERLDALARPENRNILAQESETLRAALLENSQRTRNALASLPPQVQLDSTLLLTLEAIQQELQTQLETITTLAKSNEWEAVRFRLGKQVRALESRSADLVNDVDHEVAETRSQAILNIARSQRRILWTVPATALFTLLFAGLLGLAVTRSITQPLDRLVEGSTALAKGDFNHRVPAVGDDEISRLGGVFNDMTVRLQDLYRELQRRETYLAEAQNLSHTGSFGWNVTTNELYWSAETFRIFECDPTVKVSSELVTQRIHPEDLPSVQHAFQQAARERSPLLLDLRLLLPNASVKYLQVVGRPTTDEFGNLQFLGAVTDVTARKLAEAELQQLVDFVPLYIVVLSTDGILTYANRVAREHVGIAPSDYGKVDVVNVAIHPQDADRMRTERALGLRGSEPFEIEARLRVADGIYRWFLFRYNPLLKEGSVLRWYTTGTEIESRKQQEERIRQENVRLEERTRIAQELHDTLLQSFLGASMQLGAAMNSLPSESAIKRQLDQTLELMEQGIEEARKTLEGLRSTDIPSVNLAEALSEVQHELAGYQDIDFRVSVVGQQKPLRPPIRQEIYRIGKEALVNAFRHSGAKCIQCELEYTDGALRLSVCDNGQGIDPRVLDEGREGHWGLTGMRDRATKIGAVLEISSSPSTGTDIQLSVPNAVAYQGPSSDVTAD